MDDLDRALSTQGNASLVAKVALPITLSLAGLAIFTGALVGPAADQAPLWALAGLALYVVGWVLGIAGSR